MPVRATSIATVQQDQMIVEGLYSQASQTIRACLLTCMGTAHWILGLEVYVEE